MFVESQNLADFRWFCNAARHCRRRPGGENLLQKSAGIAHFASRSTCLILVHQAQNWLWNHPQRRTKHLWAELSIFFFSSPHFRNLLTNRLTLFTKMLYPYPCYVSQDGESVASMTAQDPPGYKQPGVSEEVRNVFQRDTVVCAAVYSFSFMVWSRTCKLLRCLEPPCKEQHCSCDAGAPNEQPLLSLHWLVVIVIFEQLYPK